MGLCSETILLSISKPLALSVDTKPDKSEHFYLGDRKEKFSFRGITWERIIGALNQDTGLLQGENQVSADSVTPAAIYCPQALHDAQPNPTTHHYLPIRTL